MNETNKQLFLSKTSSVPTLTFAFLAEYGVDALDWEPESIAHSLKESVGQEVSEKNIEKVNVGTCIIYTNAAEIYPSVFEKICLTCYNETPDTDIWQPLTPEQLMEGLIDFQILTSRQFHPWQDVEAYIKAILHDNGYSEVPPAIASLASIKDTSITYAKNGSDEHQAEKADAALEYVTEILRIRMDQLKQIKHGQEDGKPTESIGNSSQENSDTGSAPA